MHAATLLIALCLVPNSPAGTVPADADGQTERRPDVVIILTDQQQGAAMSATDGAPGVPGLRTPAVDSLAARGMRFTRAYTATPQCSPARFALWTGRFPHRGVMGNVSSRERVVPGCSPPMDPSIPGIATVFAAAGYDTAYFGKWHLGGEPSRHGFAAGEARHRSDAETARRAAEFLSRQGERPVLVVVSFLDPHDVYHVAPRKQRDRGPAPSPDRAELLGAPLPASLSDDLSTKPEPQRRFRDEDQGKIAADYTDEDWRLYRYRYHLLVEKVDAEVGRVLEALGRRDGEPVVVFSSDHGDLAGAHGLAFKGPAMYEELVRVPLVIAGPGVRAGVSQALVSTLDVLPTVCDLARVTPPGGFDGVSLAPLLGESAARLGPGDVPRVAIGGRESVIVEYLGKQRWRVPIRMVRTDRWKYVRYLVGGEELYDMLRDPHEIANLATDRAFANIRQTLSRMLDAHIDSTDDPFATLGVTDRGGRPLTP